MNDDTTTTAIKNNAVVITLIFVQIPDYTERENNGNRLNPKTGLIRNRRTFDIVAAHNRLPR